MSTPKVFATTVYNSNRVGFDGRDHRDIMTANKEDVIDAFTKIENERGEKPDLKNTLKGELGVNGGRKSRRRSKRSRRSKSRRR